MSSAIQTAGADMAAIEQVLAGGDLSKLSPAQRVTFYRATCESLGLNSLTRPLEYIVLNNKLTLYVRRDGTDQLRNLRRVSVKIVDKQRVDDVYVITAHATMPDGREDESIGAVNVANLKGEALANAMMKAETKAKRRVTLSICGLGLTDESEVGDIPGARPVRVDMQTGEIDEAFETQVPPDFAAQLQNASNIDELKSVAKAIHDASKAGSLQPDVRKALGEKYRIRSSELNGVAA